MIRLLKKYRGFLYGFVLTAVLTYLLMSIGFLLIDPSEVGVNLLLFTFWWILISIPIHNIEYLKKKRLTVLKILILMVILIVTVVTDEWFDVPDNPITILLIVAFWLGIFYLIFPAFFTKYRYYIIGTYAIICSYWLYVRLYSESYEYYQNHEKGFAFVLMMLPIPIIAVLYVYEQWKWLKTLKNEKATTELALLKSQVNPHFFFNTLNNLYSLTVKNSKQAPEVILKLSDMMRYTIYEGKKDLVPLGDEVTYLENYLALHEIRHHKRVDITFRQEIDERIQVAPLLFIIPLENAFKHGVETLADDAFIRINLITDEKEVVFSIENNFDPGEIKEEPGIGLENLKRRLELIYPKRHHLIISKGEHIYKLELKIWDL